MKSDMGLQVLKYFQNMNGKSCGMWC